MFDVKNPWFKGPLFDDWPYLKRARLITESALVGPNMLRELKFWFPKDRYTTEKNGKHFESLWKTSGGWEFDVMTYDQDVMQFEGTTLGLCIEEGERVLLADGRWLPIKDVPVGVRVKNTNNSGYRREGVVVGKHYMGTKECVEVKFSGGKIVCTSDHKLWVPNRRAWVQAKDITSKDRLYAPQFSFDWKDTLDTDTAFLLGVWIGDGWLDKSVFVASASAVLNEEISKRCVSMKKKKKYVDTIKVIVLPKDLRNR
jgi:hypothetical protein